MPRPKTVADKLNEVFRYSVSLESKRGNLSDFEIRRLESMIGPVNGNRLLLTIKQLLVAEIQRDFEAFDAALEDFESANAPFPMVPSIASQALFAFNPEAASQLMHRSFEMAPDDLEFLSRFAKVAWFSGDLDLCRQMILRRERLGGEVVSLDRRALETGVVLADANITTELYQSLIKGVNQNLRNRLAGERDVNVQMEIEVDAHEDGSSGIVVQIFSDMEEERLDQLDDDMHKLISDTDTWGYDLPRVVSILVRDIVPTDELEGGQFA